MSKETGAASVPNKALNNASPTATAALWSGSQPARLLTSRHVGTGERVFPPVAGDSPLAAFFESVDLSGTGSLYSFTTIHPSPKSGLAPYALGYVDFAGCDGPVRLFGRLHGHAADGPRIGDRYEAVADDELGYTFRATSPATTTTTDHR